MGMRSQNRDARILQGLFDCTLVGTDTVQSVSGNKIGSTITASVSVGDIIIMTSGTNVGLCSPIINKNNVSAVITPAEAFPSPVTVGDSFTIVRPSFGAGGTVFTNGIVEVDPTTAVKFDATSLTGSFATMATPAANVRILRLQSTANQTCIVSFDGTNADDYLLPNTSVTYDLAANNLGLSTVIRGKHDGVAPASGSIYITMLK